MKLRIKKPATELPLRVILRITKRSLARAWKASPLGVSMFVGATLTQIASSLLQLYFNAHVINALVSYIAHHTANSHEVIFFFVAAVIMQAISTLSWRLINYGSRRIYINWQYRITPEFYRKVATFSEQTVNNKEMRTMLTKVQESLIYRPQNFTDNVLYLFQSSVRMVTSAIVIATFAPILLPLVLLSFLPSLVVQRRQSALSWNIWGVKGDEKYVYSQLSHNIFGTPRALYEVHIFNLRSYMVNKIREVQQKFAQEQQRAQNRFVWPSIGAAFVEMATTAGIDLWLISRVLARNGFGIGDYNFYSGNIDNFVNAGNLMLSQLTRLLDDGLYMADYYKLLDLPESLPMAEKPIVLSKKHTPSIEFKNVSFRYPNTDKNVFTNLSLTIDPGEKVALVGENGAGKTTLIKLLMRFYDVTEGEILIGGHNIKNIDLESWYYHVGALFQEFNRYPFDVAENIYVGRAEDKPSKVRRNKAATDAGLTNMIKKLPHNYNTVLNPTFKKGVEPSGGQWQRVALARAFYRNAHILILDEPTAAVDAKAEFEIFKHIGETYKDKTSLIVSHRFSTVRTADRIIVLEHGKIAEKGNHQELMQQAGLYHEMFTKQAQGYL